LEEYRNQISFASQSIFLLDSSIYENVAFGYAFNAINKKLVEESLKSSNIANHISQMPNGYLTKIGENGITLSGGQRQRIALARAFYRQAKIRIYDEPTSAQDYENEQKILNSIYENKKDSITFIVSHKVSTLNRCNKIIEIKNKNLNIRSN
jgi:ABC-type multidrug transport system fused ATPase/permease subunit